MAKSIRKPTTSSKKRTPKGKTPEKDVDVLGIVGAGIDAVNSVTNIIKTIGDERRKTEELKLEGVKIKAEINDKISQRENETARILKQYEVDLKEIEKAIKKIETESSENIKRIELEMEQSKQQHEFRMKGLSIIEKIVDVALEQYRFYKNDVIIFGGNNSYVVNIDLLNTMNGTIQGLTATIAQANIGGLLTTYEEE
ncbi:hypothetical protein ACPUYX_11190 [Desulfosporosinus sp. SYSU MS00001]|uniref:hypothetical protein n=1 Tax=Desulfosporosinus sp. SYSU MS00001 TaxID=3416284 RepID=UPI003CEEB4CB